MQTIFFGGMCTFIVVGPLVHNVGLRDWKLEKGNRHGKLT